MRYPWVMPRVVYRDRDQLRTIFDRRVLAAGYAKAMAIRRAAARAR